MKKLFIFLGFFGMVACSDDKTEDLLSGQRSPLEVTLNSTSLCRGETLTATIRFDATDENAVEERKDFQLYFESLENGAPSELFAEFPAEVTFPADQEQITVDFPIKESGFTGEHTVKLWVSAEGRAITGAAQTITVSDYHYITVSVKGATSMDVVEGRTFVLQAQIAEPAQADLDIAIAPENEAAKGDFENFPSTLTIAKGETVAESAEITVSWDDGETQEDHDWNFAATVGNDKYAVKPFTITRIDADLAKGDRLLDERWVYDNPNQAFYSTNTAAKYLTCPSYKEGDVLMTKNTVYGQGSKHPNRNLADTWTLLNAYEFHALDGWSYSRSEKDPTFGTYPLLTRNGWGDQSTQAIQETCYIDNDKFTNVTDDGYLRMWAANDPGTATVGTGDMTRTFGAAALYANKIGKNTDMPQSVIIREGTRVEVRARIRGAQYGFNYAIWMMGNSNEVAPTKAWPYCGEIDIMEYPQGEVVGMGTTVHQTLHYGNVSDDGASHANPTVYKSIQPSEWNIYWVEIVDGNTINVGINGETTATFTPGSGGDFGEFAQDWPFTNEANPTGFHLLLTAGLAGEWQCGPLTLEEVNAGGWAASEFLNLTYEQTKSDENTPRMEIDWIRLWINENYTTDGAGGVNPNGKFF